MHNNPLVPAGLNYLEDNIKSKDNIMGFSKEEGAKWAKGLGLPKEKDTIFFAGCGYQFESKLESLMNLIRKLDKSIVGIDIAVSLANFQKKLGLNETFLKVAGGLGYADADDWSTDSNTNEASNSNSFSTTATGSLTLTSNN